MLKPRVGIPIPHSTDKKYSDRAWPEYAAAVEQAGGEAIGIPLNLADADLKAVAADCDAYVLPGSGADVDPALYGQERTAECSDADPARERVDWFLLRDAEEKKKPLLGICFGTQSMNVYRGGTLVQDLAPLPVNHRAGRQVGVAHSALIAVDSTVGSMVDAEEASTENGFLRIGVNSSHHQALAIPGDGLRVVARSGEDAVIEAVEGDPSGPFLVGLQWHPERTLEISPTSKAIFKRLIAEATARSAAEARK